MDEEKSPKSQNEIKHELANAWSLYFWEDLDRKLNDSYAE